MLIPHLLEDLLDLGPVTLSEGEGGRVKASCKPAGEKAFGASGSDVIEAIGALHTKADFEELEGE